MSCQSNDASLLRAPVGTKLAAYVAAVAVGKAYIHQDEVERFFGTTLQRANAVVRYASAMSQSLCNVGEHVRTRYVVVYKQNIHVVLPCRRAPELRVACRGQNRRSLFAS